MSCKVQTVSREDISFDR